MGYPVNRYIVSISVRQRIQYARVVATLDSDSYATHNICMNIQSISFMIGQAFGVATTTLTGQCLGKRRVDVAKKYMKDTARLGLAVSLLLALSFVLGGRFLMGLYTDEAAVIQMGAEILLFLAAIQPFQCLQFIYSGGLSGAGDSRYTAVVIFITILIIRPGLAMLLVTRFHYGLYGAWIALAADQLLRSILIWLRYQSGRWIYVKLKEV